MYFSMFRRPLLGGLNRVWAHIESFNHGPHVQPVQDDCRLEVLRFLGLLPLAHMDFRLTVHPQITCSDASTTGGGICASVATTALGASVAAGHLRGDHRDPRGDFTVLAVGLFDGLGALRVALDVIGVPVLGYVSVEKHAPARRVVESHFPGVRVYEDVAHITDTVVQQLSLDFSQASLVLLGAGPPCQGVSGLNYDRKGALKDQRSCLFVEVDRIRSLFRRHFCWCPVFGLMESVASMDRTDRDVMSKSFGKDPLLCDAGGLTWCRRPRLYWCDWEIVEMEGFSLSSQPKDAPVQLHLTGQQDITQVTRQGWIKVQPLEASPTFTTARPRSTPGRKPAGIQQCTLEELQRWADDAHRFPPYQYCERNCLVNARNELRVPDVEEREAMLGFPVRYTAPCVGKSLRKQADYNDVRLTLLGNTWSVPVVASLLSQLFARLGFIHSMTPQEVVNLTMPGQEPSVQGRLFRMPLNMSKKPAPDASGDLAFKLTNLISIKGEDILLSSSTTQQAKFHRLRATIPARCWCWKVVTGWKWVHHDEHINALELRAILATLRWRLEHQLHLGVRFVHLTDSMVCLHALARGRSSSRKLRRTMSRMNALLLAGHVHPFWGYVHTDQNPADKPSRWGRRVRTKFKNAKA